MHHHLRDIRVVQFVSVIILVIELAEHSFAGGERYCVFKIRQTNMAEKKAMIHRRRFLKNYSIKFCDIWQNFYFYRIVNDENFKMEVEQTNFMTHLIITVQLYY